MNETELKALCTRVNGLIGDLEEHLDPEQFLEQIENFEDVLMGAMIARGYLEDALEISETTIPFIKASEVALAQALIDAEEGDDEDEDDDEDEEDE
jgi:DNA-binding transcriptional regulator WhiA